MKKIYSVLLIFSFGFVYAQRMPGTSTGTVRITESDKTIVAEISSAIEKPHIKAGLLYYWYSANTVHFTEGGFSGHLLDGRYSEFYLNKNLKVQGTFNKGLKTGPWKSWKEDGTLEHADNWKNGVLIAENSINFWQKFKRFVRKILPHHKKP